MFYPKLKDYMAAGSICVCEDENVRSHTKVVYNQNKYIKSSVSNWIRAESTESGSQMCGQIMLPD